MTRWLWRTSAIVLLAWALGFAAFTIGLSRPAGDEVTDVIVVPTGASGRITRGAQLLADHRAKRMLISGADPKASASEIAAINGLNPRLFACCVDVGHEASDTRSNAEETQAWLRARGAKSLRLVTTDWHMPRARFELDQALGSGIRIVDDAVPSDADFAVLMREYNKYLLRRIAVIAGW